MSRSYSNCQKRPWTASSIPKGICHRCRAGQRDVPWECYKADGFPLWWATQNAEDPFFGSPALNRIPYIPNERAAFYTFDLFHSFHLGVAKSLAAGCLAMASEYMWSGNIDGRMEQLSGLWITWCEENKEMHTSIPYLNRFWGGLTKARTPTDSGPREVSLRPCAVSLKTGPRNRNLRTMTL